MPRRTPLLPPCIDLNEARSDFSACRALNSILRALGPVLGKLKNFAQLCGNEAYTSGLSVYNSERHGVPGAREAVHELSSRFPGRNASKPKPGEP